MTATPRSLLDYRVIVVTGKGGAGKTTVAACLAEAARRAGKRVVLAETAASEAVAACFEDNPMPLGYSGRDLRPGLHALHIEPEAALAEYLGRQLGLRGLAERALRTQTFQQLLEAIPGWRELIILGKIWHLEQKTDASKRPLHDLIVVDAPATGHGLTFLDVPRVVQQAVHAGPLLRHAGLVEAMIHDRDRTLLLPITLPEEISVTETLELVQRAQADIDIGVDRIVVNALPTARGRHFLDSLGSLPSDLRLEALPSVPVMCDILDHARQFESTAYHQRSRLAQDGNLPIVDLPFSPTSFASSDEWSVLVDAILHTPVLDPLASEGRHQKIHTQTHENAHQSASQGSPVEKPRSMQRAGCRGRVMSHAGLENAMRDSRIVVCAGTGGVGKTTISAALALAAARAGRSTLVLTIDPAQRLADALGIDELGSRPQRVDLKDLVDPAESSIREGTLSAMMLDPKPTFDALVARFAKDESARRRVLENRIYRHFSESLAGSAEYAAMIQVHDLIESNEYDLIVVDTPPADHALDFLRAPKRMREFLESRFVRSMVHPAASASRFGARLLGRGLERVASLIERVAGGGFLEDITEFMQAVDGLSLGLDERSQRVENLLLGPDSSFVLICGPQDRAHTNALNFLSELDAYRVPLVSVIANRLRPWPLDVTPHADLFSIDHQRVQADAKVISEALGMLEVGDEIVDQLAEYATVCASQDRALRGLEAAALSRKIDFLCVQELAGEANRLEGLAEIGRMLSPASPATGREIES